LRKIRRFDKHNMDSKTEVIDNSEKINENVNTSHVDRMIPVTIPNEAVLNKLSETFNRSIRERPKTIAITKKIIAKTI